MNKARVNIGANYIGQIWSAVSVFLFVPFYINFLGTEAYGLVGFYITLMGVLAFADVGLTAALTRDMARLSGKKEDLPHKGDALKTYEIIYSFIAVFLALLIFFTSPIIASSWLTSDIIAHDRLVDLIKIMGLAIAFQLPANLFLGGLLGLQQQVLANSLQISWSLFRGVGSVAMLYWFDSSIEVFMYWQLLSNFLYLILTRKFIWEAVAAQKLKYSFRRNVITNSWRYATGMFGMALISIALLQLDKVIVSKFLTLELLGFYILAGTLATVPGVLCRPITRAMFPKFVLLVKENDFAQLKALYHKTSELVCIVLIPSALTGVFFSYELIDIWVDSTSIASSTANVSALLIIGALLQSLTAVPFHIALAFGNVTLNLKIGLLSIAIIIPSLLCLVPKYGIEGAAIAWLSMNLIVIPPYAYFLHRQFLKGQIKRWLWSSVIKPLTISLPILSLGLALLPAIKSKLLLLFYIAGVWSVAFFFILMTTQSVKEVAISFIKKIGSSYDK